MASSKIDRAVKRALRMALKEVADKLTDQIQDEYNSVIGKFYKHYTPKVYDRSGATYEASSYAQIGEGVLMPNEDSSVAGIEVDPYYIWHSAGGYNSYNQPTSYVFERTFVQGIHGMTPTEARNLMIKHQNGVFLNTEIVSVIKKGWFKDTEFIHVTPPKAPMSPSPKSLLDKKFKKEIRTDENIDPLFDSALSKYLNKYLPK